MQLLMLLTIGLQYRFSSFQWVSTLPPILIVLAYKIYINRTFVPQFRYFSPTEDELRLAKVHSERADNKGNRLEKRFGHPALHAELYTPMLHAKMMPLLGQVYSGKINSDKAKLEEYGGQNMDAQIVPGGIKIAAISQTNLEYDPVLYQRDRGELDWDQRSIASTTLMDGGSTLQPQKSQYFANSSTSKLLAYDSYLAKGPGQHTTEIELTPIDSIQEPLLSPQAYEHQQGFSSQQTLVPDTPPQLYQLGNASREAPLHRPQERSYSPSPSYTTDPQYHNARSPTPGQHASHPSQQWSSSGHGHAPRQQSQQWGNAPATRHSPQQPSQQWGNSTPPVSRHSPQQASQQWGVTGVGAGRHQPQSPSQQWANMSRSGTPVQGGGGSTQGQAYPPSAQRQQQQQQQQQQPQNPRQAGGNNMAGRGAYGRGY